MEKVIIMRAVLDAHDEGFTGVDVHIDISNNQIDDIKNWCMNSFAAFNLIDWNRDDPHNLGVGVNINGAHNHNMLSFDFNLA